MTVFTFDEAGAFRERIEAARGDAPRRLLGADATRACSPPIEQPRELRQLSPGLESRPVAGAPDLHAAGVRAVLGLDETIVRTERAGLDATRYRLQYEVLLARPLLFVAMVFVAASVSLRFFRFGGVADGARRRRGRASALCRDRS